MDFEHKSDEAVINIARHYLAKHVMLTDYQELLQEVVNRLDDAQDRLDNKQKIADVLADRLESEVKA